jgi:four helix bundle protein
MKYLYGFEKLEVWKLSKGFIKQIYKLTGKFPVEERYGLTSQLRRASISIASNIAEGNGRISGRERSRFAEIAYASAIEVIAQIEISYELGYLNEEILQDYKTRSKLLTNKINSLYSYHKRKSLNKDE